MCSKTLSQYDPILIYAKLAKSEFKKGAASQWLTKTILR